MGSTYRPKAATYRRVKEGRTVYHMGTRLMGETLQSTGVTYMGDGTVYLNASATHLPSGRVQIVLDKHVPAGKAHEVEEEAQEMVDEMRWHALRA